MSFSMFLKSITSIINLRLILSHNYLIMKRLVFYSFILLLLVGCGSLHIEKRRYNKGFYISLNKKIKESSEQTQKSDSDQKTEYTTATSKNEEHALHKEKDEPADGYFNEETEVQQDKSTIDKQSVLSKTKNKKTHLEPSSIQKSKINQEQKYTRQSEQSNSSGLFYFLFLLLVPFMSKFKNRMYRHSKWASENKLKAQLLIPVLSLAGMLTSFLLGNLIQCNVGQEMQWATFSGAAFGTMVYFTAGKDEKQGFVRKRQGLTLFNLSTFFATFSLGSAMNSLFYFLIEGEDGERTPVQIILALFLGILIFAAMIAAIYGLAVYACTLACSGYAALSILVFFGGGFITTFLGIFGIASLINPGKLYRLRNVKTALIISGIIFTIFSVILFLS